MYDENTIGQVVCIVVVLGILLIGRNFGTLLRSLLRVFESKEAKQERQQHEIRAKRVHDCIHGMVPLDEMTWREQLVYWNHGWEGRSRICLNAGYKWSEVRMPYDKIMEIVNDHIGELTEAQLLIVKDALVRRLELDADIIPKIEYVKKYAHILCREALWSYTEHYVQKYFPTWEEKKQAYEIIKSRINHSYVNQHLSSTIVDVAWQVRREEEIKQRDWLRKEWARKKQEREQYIRDVESRGGFKYVKDGEGYERFVAFCIKDAGYECQIVGRSGDYGADIIATVHGREVAIQCKFYSQPVGYEAVQQVFTAMAFYHCSRACVVTNQGFTQQAKNAGVKLKVGLIVHGELKTYFESI